MIKTVTISRTDLKVKNFKAAKVTKSGSAPAKRDIDLLVVVLKKVLAQ